MFIDAANAPKVKGKVSPSLIAAIMWDEIVGNDKIAKKFGSEGYSKDDFKDETNDFFLFEGHTYGPFQISIATAVSVIEGGYVKAPIDYDTFFENIDPKYAYHDNEGRPVKRNNGLYLKDLGKEKLEAELTKFPFAVKVSAGRLAQTIDFWNVPPDNNGENGGSDLRYADEILGTLYSKGLVGSNGVNDDPTPNDRGLGIANKSKEFNELFFEGKYMQLKATPIN